MQTKESQPARIDRRTDKYGAAEEAFVRETMDRVEQSARAARELAEDLGLPPEAEYDIHAARHGKPEGVVLNAGNPSLTGETGAEFTRTEPKEDSR